MPTKSRFSSSFLIEYSQGNVLLDIGPGTIEKLRRRNVNPNTISRIFITHLHLDHVLDLPAIIKIRLFDEVGGPNPAPPNLDVYGPVGLRNFLYKMISPEGVYSYLSEMMKYYSYLRIREVGEGLVEESVNLRVYSSHVEHYDSVAYRFEIDGYSLAYSGDTVYDERMIKLAENVDILIHECSFPKELLLGKHTSDEELIKVVKSAQPKILLVTHLYPAWEGREGQLEEKLRRETGCRVYVVKDMDILEV
ncbi:MAG: MBL fold metallo-hydrolase [Aigarchaeota archaeon]|nr:MBL fold metallo-hydrolase [Aigarchaeota archaeon]MDW7986447.1 MBL fold metallo-hydrolase [Nitrososphaerota archaeon]